MSIILSVVAATLLAATNVQAQNSGDIRLVNDVESDIGAAAGRLEVFMNGKWGTVCGKSGTDMQAVADTACRQLGFKESLIGGSGTVTQLGFPVASSSTPINIGSINCPSTFFDGICSTDYNQHVLRCAVDTKVDTAACTHDIDIGVSCSIESLTSSPYESQVALYSVGNEHHSPNVSLSSGALVIFFDKSSKPGVVCRNGFDQDAADTACRQLGFTNANNFNTSLQTKKQTFWDAGLQCKSQSHSCLNDCFSKTPNNHTTCTHLVYLGCEFDLSRKDTESSGCPRLCDTTVDNSCKPQIVEFTITVIAVIVVVIALAIIAACTVCITCLVCCLVPGCLIYRRKAGYQPVN